MSLSQSLESHGIFHCAISIYALLSSTDLITMITRRKYTMHDSGCDINYLSIAPFLVICTENVAVVVSCYD